MQRVSLFSAVGTGAILIAFLALTSQALTSPQILRGDLSRAGDRLAERIGPAAPPANYTPQTRPSPSPDPRASHRNPWTKARCVEIPASTFNLQRGLQMLSTGGRFFVQTASVIGQQIGQIAYVSVESVGADLLVRFATGNSLGSAFSPSQMTFREFQSSILATSASTNSMDLGELINQFRTAVTQISRTDLPSKNVGEAKDWLGAGTGCP